MYCMELLIPESGREGWDYERRCNEKQLFKGQLGSRGKAEEKAESAAESKDFAGFSVAFLAVTAILGVVLHDAAMVTDFSRKILLPV